METAGALGAAHAAARFHDNDTARQALNDLDGAVRYLATQSQDDAPDAA